MSKPLVIISAPVPDDLLAHITEQAHILDVPVGQSLLGAVPVQQQRQVVAILTTVDTRVDAAVMDVFPNLRVVSNFAVGFDNIDIDAATQRNILVCNTPKVLDGAVADLTFGLIIGLSRDLLRNDTYVRDGSWARRGAAPLTRDVRGKTLGLLGMGRIGCEVARMAKAFGMTVIYHNRHPDAEHDDLATYCERDALFAESDFVSIHTPLNESTRGSVGTHEFGLMKPTAYLINTGRGAVIDENALVQALQAGQIAGAGLDVMVQEPLPGDHPLCTLPNVILQPHMGSATIETRRAMVTLATQNLLNALAGTRPDAMVNPQVWS